jgi:hypothetical protein
VLLVGDCLIRKHIDLAQSLQLTKVHRKFHIPACSSC